MSISFSAKPHFLQENKMQRHKFQRPVGSSVRLKCKATGKPKPAILWFKDGRVLSNPDPEGSHEHIQWTLRLRKLHKDDSGHYTCKVFNTAGQINHTYTLSVIGKLQWVMDKVLSNLKILVVFINHVFGLK